MNQMLWRAAFREARALWVACAALLFLFQWIYVWVTSKIELPAIADFLLALPEEFQNLAGIPVDQVATTAGRIAMGYVDPAVLVATGVWGIARGSDAVSGPIQRGTMEMVLAQPVRRLTVLSIHVSVTVLGALALGVCCFLGTAAGLATVPLDESISAWRFVAPSVNVAALSFFVGAVATMASSWGQYRHRTVGLVGGFFVLSLVLEALGKMVVELEWLRRFTFLAAFEPQRMVMDTASAWQLSLRYDGVLVGLGLAALVVAGIVFSRRDLPAPL